MHFREESWGRRAGWDPEDIPLPSSKIIRSKWMRSMEGALWRYGDDSCYDYTKFTKPKKSASTLLSIDAPKVSPCEQDHPKQNECGLWREPSGSIYGWLAGIILHPTRLSKVSECVSEGGLGVVSMTEARRLMHWRSSLKNDKSLALDIAVGRKPVERDLGGLAIAYHGSTSSIESCKSKILAMRRRWLMYKAWMGMSKGFDGGERTSLKDRLECGGCMPIFHPVPNQIDNPEFFFHIIHSWREALQTWIESSESKVNFW